MIGIMISRLPVLLYGTVWKVHWQVVCAWNGMAIGAFASASRILANEKPKFQATFPVDGRDPEQYLEAAVKVGHCSLFSPLSTLLSRKLNRHSSHGFPCDACQACKMICDISMSSGDYRADASKASLHVPCPDLW